MQINTLITAFRKSVCTTVSVTMLFAPTWAMGTDTNMKAIGREAQSFATEQAGDIKANPPTLVGNELQIPMKDGTSLSFGTGELSNQSDSLNRQWTPEDIAELKGLFDGSDDEGVEKGNAAKEKLFGNTNTLEGQIHQIMIDGSNQVMPDWSKDQIMIEAEKILDQYETNDITDCKTDKFLIDKSKIVHETKLEQCEQVVDRSGNCQITHDYRAGVIRHYDGPYNIESCGEGCTTIWLGKVGDNYWPGGSCKLYTDEILFVVTNPDAITRAELDYAAYDDQMQVWIGPRNREQKVYEGPNWGKFPYNDHNNDRRPGTTCELGTHWIWDPKGDGFGCTESACRYTQQSLGAINITSQIKSVGKGGIARFYLRDAIGGYGEAFARMRIYYDAKKAIIDDAWTPPECVQNVYAINDKFAKGSYTCISMPTIGSDGCAQIDGVFVCPHHLNPSPLPGISNLCMKVNVNADYDFYKGQMDCWTDINGNLQCPNNQGGSLDKCSKLEEKGCQFISSKCTEGALGASGTCYVNEATYDCGKDVVINDSEEVTETTCSGDVSCMGEDCVGITETESESFAKISALMNALQYMAQDMECTGTNEDGTFTQQEDVKCNVFAGNPSKCKIAVGGISDCCENQNPIGMGPYLGMIMSKSTGEHMLEPLNKYLTGEIIDPEYIELLGHGAWSSVSQIGAASWAVSGYLNVFSSFIENISSWHDLFFPSMDVLIAHAKTAIKLYIKQCLQDLFKEVAKKLWGNAAGSGAGSSMSGPVAEALGAAGAALGVIAAIYAAYCVAVMLIQAIYKCTEDEMQLTAMRDVGNCHYIGSYCDSKVLGMCVKKIRSYCCFSSPLSRIIQEQLRKQGDRLGADFSNFGSAKEPRCAGIPLEKVGSIDWDQVDLSEWVAILENNGKFPNSTTVDVNKLTGSESKLNYDGERVDTVTRNKDRIQYVDVDAERKRAHEEYQVDTGYRGQQK